MRSKSVRLPWWLSRRDLVAAFLLAIVANVVVAWGLVQEAPMPGETVATSDARARAWWRAFVGPEPAVVHVQDHTLFIGYRRVHLQGGAHAPRAFDDHDVTNLKWEAAGFPFLGLESHRVWKAERNELHGGVPIEPRIVSPGSGHYGWIDSLPLRVRPVPFAANVLLYVFVVVLSHRFGRWPARARPARRPLRPAVADAG